jgi:5-methylcytosine-specific restriction endonuclease McrBC GTP-binding regulatory subunit McrB
MKSKKAFIKLNGEIGEKEHPAIEYIDKKYDENQQKQKDEFNELLLKMNVKVIKINKKNKISDGSMGTEN